MKKKKHWTVKNSMGGCFCVKCHSWSNVPDGLKGDVCLATRKEAKENRKQLKNKIPHKIVDNPNT